MSRYNKKEIFENSKKLVEKHKLLFIQDIIDFLPLSKPTFYDYYPLGSDELNELKKMLDGNKVAVKSYLRAKWEVSDNATLQMALYKLASNEEEHKKLAQNYTDFTTKGESLRGVDSIFLEDDEAKG